MAALLEEVKFKQKKCPMKKKCLNTWLCQFSHVRRSKKYYNECKSTACFLDLSIECNKVHRWEINNIFYWIFKKGPNYNHPFPIVQIPEQNLPIYLIKKIDQLDFKTYDKKIDFLNFIKKNKNNYPVVPGGIPPVILIHSDWIASKSRKLI